MSLGSVIGKRHLLIGAAMVSVAGAGWSIFKTMSSPDSYTVSSANSVSIVRSPASKSTPQPRENLESRLFAVQGKQNRADYATGRATVTVEVDARQQMPSAKSGDDDIQIMAASFTPVDMARPGPTRFAGAAIEQDVNRGSKTDLLKPARVAVGKTPPPSPKAEEQSLNGPGMSAAMFLISPSAANSGFGNAKSDGDEGVEAVEAKPTGESSWSDLIELARVTGGDGEKIKEGIFGNLTEKEFRAREFRCMTTAIYFEARGESIKGQTAVAQVIMTRVRSDYYPNTICGVVFQGQWNRHACQFSFACDGRTDRPKGKEQWKTAIDVAKKVISGQSYLKDVGEATHYHATYVSPKWRKKMNKVAQIGVHIFYKAPFVRPLVASTEFDQL